MAVKDKVYTFAFNNNHLAIGTENHNVYIYDWLLNEQLHLLTFLNHIENLQYCDSGNYLLIAVEDSDILVYNKKY